MKSEDQNFDIGQIRSYLLDAVQYPPRTLDGISQSSLPSTGFESLLSSRLAASSPFWLKRAAARPSPNSSLEATTSPTTYSQRLTSSGRNGAELVRFSPLLSTFSNNFTFSNFKTKPNRLRASFSFKKSKQTDGSQVWRMILRSYLVFIS